jgi:hypothetical protein
MIGSSRVPDLWTSLAISIRRTKAVLIDADSVSRRFVERGDDHEIETEYGTRLLVVKGIWLRG